MSHSPAVWSKVRDYLYNRSNGNMTSIGLVKRFFAGHFHAKEEVLEMEDFPLLVDSIRHHMDELGIPSKARMMKSLTHMMVKDLDSSWRFLFDGLRLIKDKPNEYEKIDVEYLLKYIGSDFLESAKRLEVDSQPSIRALLEHMPNLEEIHFEGASNAEAFSESLLTDDLLPKLRSAHFEDTLITSYAIPGIARRENTLESLSMNAIPRTPTPVGESYSPPAYVHNHYVQKYFSLEVEHLHIDTWKAFELCHNKVQVKVHTLTYGFGEAINFPNMHTTARLCYFRGLRYLLEFMEPKVLQLQYCLYESVMYMFHADRRDFPDALHHLIGGQWESEVSDSLFDFWREDLPVTSSHWSWEDSSLNEPCESVEEIRLYLDKASRLTVDPSRAKFWFPNLKRLVLERAIALTSYGTPIYTPFEDDVANRDEFTFFGIDVVLF